MKLLITQINLDGDGLLRNYSCTVLESDIGQGTTDMKGMICRFSFVSDCVPLLPVGLVLDVKDPVPWEWIAPTDRVTICLPDAVRPEETGVTK